MSRFGELGSNFSVEITNYLLTVGRLAMKHGENLLYTKTIDMFSKLFGCLYSFSSVLLICVLFVPVVPRL